MTQCSRSASTPADVWYPGGDRPASGNIDSRSGYSLHDSMLPGGAVTSPPCEPRHPCELGDVEDQLELIE